MPGCPTISRLVLAGAMLLLAAQPISADETRAGRQPPNILLMVLDDLGYAEISANGCADFSTPNIDAIGARGARFTDFHVSAPVCSPSRAGLLTGRYQTRFGHEFNHPRGDHSLIGLPVTESTIAHRLKAAGYVTGHLGKWHLGNPREPGQTPADRGFMESAWFPGQNKLPPFFLIRNGKVRESASPYVDTAIADEACQFMAAHQGEPWFLFAALLTPHVPLDLPVDVAAGHPEIESPARRACANAMELVDAEIGRIMSRLRELGEDDNTLVILMSDNGAYPANGWTGKPFIGTKGTLWEGGIRVPCLMQWPDVIPAGQVIDDPVIALDCVPTMLAAAGVDPAASTELDGVDLLPRLKGTGTMPADRVLYWRYGEQFAVRRGNWKFTRAIRNRESGDFEIGLHDLTTDIRERRDQSAKQPALREELLRLYAEWDQANIQAAWEPNFSEEDQDGGEGLPGGY
jgi:arylsulfatase A-like enzyme